MKNTRTLWLALLLLLVLCPLGLYLPHYFKAGSAWGEWGTDEIQQTLGYAPEGMKRNSEIWKSAWPDYQPHGNENASLPRQSFFYILSGVLGMIACAVGGQLLVKILKGKEK